MSILPDHHIRSLIRDGHIENADQALVNPASLDLRLGNSILIETAEGHHMVPLDISNHTKEKPYTMVPGQFILADTMEVFHLPDDLAGIFCLKSSRAREGYEHSHAGFADPGWHSSTLTLELKNARQLQHLPLWPGMRIGQMVFFQMRDLPVASYAVTGSYNSDVAPTASKQFGSDSLVPGLII